MIDDITIIVGGSIGRERNVVYMRIAKALEAAGIHVDYGEENEPEARAVANASDEYLNQIPESVSLIFSNRKELVG